MNDPPNGNPLHPCGRNPSRRGRLFITTPHPRAARYTPVFLSGVGDVRTDEVPIPTVSDFVL